MKYKNRKPVATKKATALSKDNLAKIMSATYQPNSMLRAIDEYVPDPTISDNRVKVFHNSRTKHTVVAHRGSQTGSDWAENAAYLFGIKRGSNWSHSRKKQKEAETKYGTANLTTVGHSKGALHAQEFGQKGEVVTLNKPVNLIDAVLKKVPKNQTDYRGEGDVVSILRPFERGNKAVTLRKEKKDKKSWNPIKNILKEHGTDTLYRS